MWNPPSIGPSPLQALTLLRPWEIAFTATDDELKSCLAGRKDIENRSWPPPAKYVGSRIALHAGKGWDPHGEDFLKKLGFSEALLGRSEPSRLVAVVRVNDRWQMGTMRLSGDFPYDSVWGFGPWCWSIGDVQVLRTPVPCKGAQGLWRVPDAEARLVRSQVQGLS